MRTPWLVLLLLTTSCAATRSRALPLSQMDLPRALSPIAATAEKMGFHSVTNDTSAWVDLQPDTGTKVVFAPRGTGSAMTVFVDEDRVQPGQLEAQFAWAFKAGDEIFERASRWFGVAPATPNVVVNVNGNTATLSPGPTTEPMPMTMAPTPSGLPPPPATPVEAPPAPPEVKGAWIERNHGFKPGLMIGAGFFGMAGIPLEYAMGRFSVMVIPQYNLTDNSYFYISHNFGLDLGVRFALGRRLSVGAGLTPRLFFPGYQPNFGEPAARVQLDLSLTVAVRLGATERHALMIYGMIPLTDSFTWQTPVLAYSYRFDWEQFE